MKLITRLVAGPLALAAGITAALLAPVTLSSSPVAAGGWVVVSLDATPQIVAGEPTDVGFTVLRHGVTPETSDDLAIVVTSPDGTSQRFAAAPDGAVGHHVARVTLDGGTYTWSVSGGIVAYELGSLDVGSADSGPSWLWDVGQWGGLGLAAALGGFAAGDMVRRRRRAVPAAA